MHPFGQNLYLKCKNRIFLYYFSKRIRVVDGTPGQQEIFIRKFFQPFMIIDVLLGPSVYNFIIFIKKFIEKCQFP